MDKKPSEKIKLIWATFGLVCVTSILSIVLGRGETIASAIVLSFGGMSGYLFKVRKDEKVLDTKGMTQ